MLNSARDGPQFVKRPTHNLIKLDWSVASWMPASTHEIVYANSRIIIDAWLRSLDENSIGSDITLHSEAALARDAFGGHSPIRYPLV